MLMIVALMKNGSFMTSAGSKLRTSRTTHSQRSKSILDSEELKATWAYFALKIGGLERITVCLVNGQHMSDENARDYLAHQKTQRN